MNPKTKLIINVALPLAVVVPIIIALTLYGASIEDYRDGGTAHCNWLRELKEAGDWKAELELYEYGCEENPCKLPANYVTITLYSSILNRTYVWPQTSSRHLCLMRNAIDIDEAFNLSRILNCTKFDCNAHRTFDFYP